MHEIRQNIRRERSREFDLYLKERYAESYNLETGYINKEKTRFFRTLQALEPFVPEKPGLNFIDVGVFPGYFAMVCSAVFEAKMSGIGLNIENEFKDSMERENISTVSADLTQTLPPEICGKYDVVTALEILEHIDPRDAMTFLSNLSQLATPGGLVFITTPNVATLRKRKDGFFGRSPYPILSDSVIYTRNRYWVHLREYTLAETRLMIKEAGLEMLSCGYMNLTHWNVSIFRKMLNAVLYVWPALRHGMYIIARKPE